MKAIAAIVTLLVLVPLAGAQGRHHRSQPSHWQAIRQDEKAVQADEAKLKQDRRKVIALRNRLNSDLRHHHQAAAQRDQRALVKASDAMKFDQAQLKLDREKLDRERNRFHINE